VSENIEIPSFVISKFDDELAEQLKVLNEVTDRIRVLENLRSMAVDSYLTREKQRQETERLLELGRQYDSILKGDNE
jgi:hypothetical protein